MDFGSRAAAIFQSPSIMSLLHTTARMLTVAVVIALALVRYDSATVNAWLLLMTFIGIQILADMGFAQTFARFFAYAMGGASTREMGHFGNDEQQRETSDRAVNVAALGEISSVSHSIYLKLAIAWALFLGVGGSLMISGTLNSLEGAGNVWAAWALVGANSTVWIYGAQYTAVLRGTGKVALQQGLGALITIGQLLFSAAAIWFGADLFGLSIAYCSWFSLYVVLAARASGRKLGSLGVPRDKPDAPRELVSLAWNRSWKSGIGIAMGYGLLQFSGIVYSQTTTPDKSASYLLALRVLASINQFGQVPFYAHLPRFSRLRAERDIKTLVRDAGGRMHLSLWVIAVSYTATALLIGPVLAWMNSETQFVDTGFWLILATGAFLERYGAMHLQLYTTTNHVVWHIVNSITGLVYVASLAVLFPIQESYAFAWAFLLSNLLFYGWYSARLSITSLGVSVFDFEKRSAIPPGVFFGLASIAVLFFQMGSI